MKLLVTGAAGKVGRACVDAAMNAGHEVVACDIHYRDDLPVKLHMVDLLERTPIYALLEGCDAVIHLANHPGAGALPSPARLLCENVMMTSHVLWAAREVGIDRMVFVSSIQAVIRRHTPLRRQRRSDPETPSSTLTSPASLPLRGSMPADPGHNAYGQSKVAGECVLQGLSVGCPSLRAVAVRMPLVVSEGWSERWIKQPRSRSAQDGRIEVDWVTYILLNDAAALLVAAAEHAPPGYLCTLPGQTVEVEGETMESLAQRVAPDATIDGPLDKEFGGLIDCREAYDVLGWRPSAEPIKRPADKP